ncbi:MAG: glutamate racemase [Deltaproteobacteria bacterium]|nr:glutamate racemase [Deltaproteobacteria bacterium]
MNIPNCPVGVFDSGIGGLTVVKELQKFLPNENIVYFGDTARLPYGSKSKRLVTKYSLENTIFLNSKNVKIVVIACNTASAASADFLKQFIKIPVIGVIEAGALLAAKYSKNKKVGVIGTKSTVKSRAYSKYINKLDPTIKVYEQSTPLLVHIVEENWINKNITKSILKEYIDPLIKLGIDTLILGCTHYPLLANSIKECTKSITLVDSSTAIATIVQNTLEGKKILSNRKTKGYTHIYLSDLTPEISIWMNDFLGENFIGKIKKYNSQLL